MNALKSERGGSIIKKPGKPLPIYEQVRRQLVGRMQSGIIKHGEELPSASQIVKEFDVSYHAVKTAINLLENDGLIKFKNGKGRGKKPVISLKAKDQTQYTITFLRTVKDNLDLQITHGIYQYCQKNNLKAMIIDCPPSDLFFANSIKNSESNGVIIFPHGGREVEDAISCVAEKGKNIVLVDRNFKNINTSSVSIDNAYGAYLACTHLFSSRSEPIFYLGSNPTVSSTEDRRHGWKIAMQEHNYHNFSDFSWIFERDIREKEDYVESHLRRLTEHIGDFVAKHVKESGLTKLNIFAENDYSARVVYTVAEKAGLKIGTDILIVGFGNYPFCQNLPVPLTSIDQKNVEVGYESAKLLHMKYLGTLTEKIHKKVAPELIIRESSGKNITP